MLIGTFLVRYNSASSTMSAYEIADFNRDGGFLGEGNAKVFRVKRLRDLKV